MEKRIDRTQLLDRCRRTLQSSAADTPYSHTARLLFPLEQQVLSEEGTPGLADLRCQLMQNLIMHPVLPMALQITDEIAQLRTRSIARILGDCEVHDGMQYIRNADLFDKDLAILLGHMFPAGARVVEQNSGFPRSIMLRGPLGQRLRFAAMLTGARGNSPYYQLHVHLRELDEFHENGWRRTLGRLSRMCQRNENVKGIFGSGWLYDAQLPAVSPKLWYIREIAAEGGADFFYWGPDVSGSALNRSPTRRRLFEEGKYIPRSYYAIWPRSRLVSRCARW